MTAAKEQIQKAITTYVFIVSVFERLIESIEVKNKNDIRWFTFSEKIGRKYLNQALTLQDIFYYENYVVKNSVQKRFIDFSSIFMLLRGQLENYAVFHHLFVDNCNVHEKILRFRLWELDGLRNFPRKNTQDDIEYCINAIKECPYFQTLAPDIQHYLIERSLWKFNNSSLAEKKDKWNIGIQGIVNNTGIGKIHLTEWYEFTSRYTHTLYSSIFHLITSNEESEIYTEYIALMQATFITSFFIKDFYRIYGVAKFFFDNLPINEQEIINSYDIRKSEN